jgi:phosphatidylinositol alpha-1,6-mannosyltransferase
MSTDTGRIVLVSQVFPPARGGSGRWLWELYRRLSDDVHVLTSTGDGTETFDLTQSLAIERCDWRFPSWSVASLGGARAYVRAYRRLAALVGQSHANVVHCAKALPEGLLGLFACWRHGTSYCCYVHGEELTLARASRDLTWLTRLVLSRAALVVANSTNTQRLLDEDWHVSSRVVVMHPGVDTTRFVPRPLSADIRAKLGWTGRRVVLTVGALQKRKGQDMMLRALPAIRMAQPDVLYVMAGEGWERDYLERIVDELQLRDSVQFREVTTDAELAECYQQCDLFALPNRRVGWDIEGFGIVLLEAQACGKAVLAGRSGGTADTLIPGVTGELVDCETPEPLANAVVTLLRDPARLETMGTRGRAHMIERFDWSVLVRQATSLFASMGRSITQ